MAETGQPYAYTGDDPVNGVDPMGLSWYNPSWAHKAAHGIAQGAKKVGHFVATHKKAVVTAAIIIATIPLDATGAGEAIDAEAVAADVAADGAEEAAEEASEQGAQEAGEQASEEPAEEGSSCGGQSFSPDTEVQLANGSKIPISQVRVGDMVLATDTHTGKLQAEPVTALWVNHDNDLMDVIVKTASGTSTIQSTQHHLFWDLNTHTWVQADGLSGGTSMRTSNGATATVIDTMVIPGAADMWDLTVNDDHDFYVVVSAGSQTAVLAHNCPDLNLDDEGETHIEARHMPGGAEVDASSGIFNAGEDLQNLVDEAEGVESTGPNEYGNFERMIDAGRIVGNAPEVSGGLPTTIYMVVHDVYGGIISMFPIAG